MQRTAGAILGGGRSRRMGSDKAFLEVDGQPLILRTLEVLREVCGDVVIVGGTEEKYSGLGALWYPDIIEDAGPLGGIYTTLRRSSGDVVIAACDLPKINSDVLRFLLTRHDPAKAVITVPAWGDIVQPLLGIYNPSCLTLLERFLENGGRKVRQFLAECTVQTVSLDSASTPFPSDILLNINTLQDYHSVMGKASHVRKS